MNHPYSEAFSVRLQEVDGWNRLRSKSLLGYLEQATVNLTTGAGFDYAWYEAQGTAWTIRSTALQRLGIVKYGDQLSVTAWVSSIQRVRVQMEYEVRLRDGQPVAVGRSEWVYIDRHSRRPRAVDAGILESWPQQESSALWTAGPSFADGGPRPPHSLAHVVYWLDADVLGVVSNVAYVDWLEQAAREALQSWGYSRALPESGFASAQIDPQSLTLHYQGPTRPGETVTITTVCSGVDPAKQQIAVAQTIYGADEDLRLRADYVFHLCANNAEQFVAMASQEG